MSADLWKPVSDLLSEIKKAEGADVPTAALALAYVCIDTMAYLAMPDAQSYQTRQDFIWWVEKYLQSHPTQPYQYVGLEVYAARCALLHAFGSEAELHRKDKTIKQFGYSDGHRHHFDPTVSNELVIIGLAALLTDLAMGVLAFLAECKKDATLRARVEGRLPNLLSILPNPKHDESDLT